MFDKINKLKNNISDGIQSGKDSVKSSVNDSIQKVTDIKDDTQKGISDTYNGVTDSISNTYNGVTDSINDKIETVTDTVSVVTDTVSVVSNKVTSTVSGVVTTVEVIGGKIQRSISWILGFSVFIVEAGITIAAVVAPVPTIIGVCIIYLMTTFIMNVSEEVDEKQSNKKLKKTIETLKKYGKIPKNAIVKTDYLEMDINSETGEIKGTILKGDFQNASISELSISNIENLTKFSEDKQTRDLLEAYLEFRIKKEKNNVKIVNE